jgi:hypothetical protein
MEQTLNIQTPTGKIYKEKTIWAGTFLGGPLVAGFLIAANFKTFNQPGNVKKTWIYAAIATVAIFGGVFLIPDNVRIPSQIIPLIYTAITFALVQRYQGQNISAHINAGGQLYGWWRTVAIALIGLAITIIPIFGIALLYDKNTNAGTDTKIYGIMKHEIAFDKNNISAAEVDKIASGLTSTTFFDDTAKKYVYAEKKDNRFEISISSDNSVATDPKAVAPFVQLRNDLQLLFPANKIIFNLVVDRLDNVVKRLE